MRRRARRRPTSPPAGSRSIATSESRHGTRLKVLRTRAELREALAAVPRPLGLVPTMGWLHDGHRSLMQRARAENATTIATIFVNPRQFNEAADYQRYPRNEARDLAIVRGGGHRPRLRAAGRGDLPAGLRHDRLGRGGRPPARGRRSPGPLRRRRDGRRDPVRPRRRRAGLLRPEGRPAGHGHPPDGPRPRDPDRGHRLPDRPRARRPRAVVAQRPPVARRARRRPGPAPGAARRARALGGRRALRRRAPRRRCARRSRRSRSPDPTTSRSPTAPRWPSSTASTDRRSCRSRSGSATTRLIDNEVLADGS